MKWIPVILALALGGCASARRGDAITPIAAGQYEAAFQAAKDVLAGYHYDLQRVDARAGIISTAPRPSPGLAAPWDNDQSTIAGEWEDLLNQQMRRVRVTFEPADAPEGGVPGPDLRLLPGPLTARFEVFIDRRHRPGWRVETSSIRLSSFTRDPDLSDRQMWPRYDTPFTQDRRLADRLGRALKERLASAPAGDGSGG
ncbi:MAG: hypothetical protein IT437_06320 [Phycisphaerales bacterium]|nr:hypothetical protein [Phycisphaerales bacterium]